MYYMILPRYKRNILAIFKQSKCKYNDLNTFMYMCNCKSIQYTYIYLLKIYFLKFYKDFL